MSEPTSNSGGAGAVIAGRYELVRLVGRGGFGEVWLGRRSDSGQPVAVKLLAAREKPDNVARERFLRESQTVAKLRNPATVRLYDSGCEPDGRLFMVLEYIEGDTLDARLDDLERQGKAPTQREVGELAVQVLRSLAEAHAAGVVHRDIKPANLMLQPIDSDACAVRVLDFGVARVQQSKLTGAGVAVGTPAYMSPEQCLAHPVDGRSDLYSLGAVMFRCLAGRPVFEGPTGHVVMAHVTRSPPPLLAKARSPVTAEFAALVDRSLAKDPENRFADATAMRRAVEAILDSQPPWQSRAGLLVPRADWRESPSGPFHQPVATRPVTPTIDQDTAEAVTWLPVHLDPTRDKRK